jgi:hypothetical protein
MGYRARDAVAQELTELARHSRVRFPCADVRPGAMGDCLGKVSGLLPNPPIDLDQAGPGFALTLPIRTIAHFASGGVISTFL